MKSWQFIIALVLGLICFSLSITLVVFGNANQTLQAQLQAQQAEINKGNVSQQLGTTLLREIAAGAARNQNFRDFLTRHGLAVPEKASSSPAPAAAPSPTPRLNTPTPRPGR